MQTEYLVPFERAVEAIKAVRSIGPQLKDLLLITEIRAIAADDLWLSMAYKRRSAALHFTWKRDMQGVVRLLPMVEQKLAQFEPRPHWGKVFTMPPGVLQARYARLSEFKALARSYDPEGKFDNDFIRRYLYGQV